MRDEQTDEFECLRMDKVAFQEDKELLQIVLFDKLVRDTSIEDECFLGLDERPLDQKDTKRVASCCSLVSIPLRNQQIGECLVVCWENANK